MEIIVASNNNGKIREIKAILGEVHSIKSMGECGIDIEIEETGTTFVENALLKAKAIYEMTNKPVLSDDSGLVVRCLNGEPGVYSARYSLLNAVEIPLETRAEIDRRNNKLLLENMSQKEDRYAEFVSVVVLYYDKDKYIVKEGRTAGEILYTERGSEGFGYDPLFLSKELNKTFAEATMNEKNTVSHRARALKALSKQLNEQGI